MCILNGKATALIDKIIDSVVDAGAQLQYPLAGSNLRPDGHRRSYLPLCYHKIFEG
jgi:hypothetical protein